MFFFSGAVQYWRGRHKYDLWSRKPLLLPAGSHCWAMRFFLGRIEASTGYFDIARWIPAGIFEPLWCATQDGQGGTDADLFSRIGSQSALYDAVLSDHHLPQSLFHRDRPLSGIPSDHHELFLRSGFERHLQLAQSRRCWSEMVAKWGANVDDREKTGELQWFVWNL